MLEQSKTHIGTERGLFVQQIVGRKEPNTRTTALAANFAVQAVHVAVYWLSSLVSAAAFYS